MNSLTIFIKTKNNYNNVDSLLLSLFAQSIQDYKIVFVDYFSTDNTFKLLKTYTKLDYRIAIYQTTENFRKFCTNIVDTKYCYFLNNEMITVLAQNCLLFLLNDIIKSNSDFVYSNCTIMDNKNFNILPNFYINEEDIIIPLKNLKQLKTNILAKMNLKIFGKMFLSEYLKKNIDNDLYLFDSKSIYYEKNSFIIQYIDYNDYLKMLCEKE